MARARLSLVVFLCAGLAACDGDGGTNRDGETGTDTVGGGDEGGVGPSVGRVTNGDFEQGPGVGWSASHTDLIIPASQLGISAYSGQYLAWLGPAPDDRTSIALWQTVVLPATPVSLAFATWIDSEELCDPPWWDDMGLYVNDVALIHNDRVCNQDSTGGWITASADLAAFAGQTVTIRFHLYSPAGDMLASTVVLDAVRLVP